MVSASTSIVGRPVAEFNLQQHEFLASWRRRLVIGWPGLERSWYRWADRNIFPVVAVTLEDDLCPAIPSWTEIRLTKPQLAIISENWRAALRQWRGIYLITDGSDRRHYVGSAGGKENMLQRWTNYSETGHGGNKQLRGRNPDNFVFSILELVSPTTLLSDLTLLESSWKRRLGTYWPQGLNES